MSLVVWKRIHKIVSYMASKQSSPLQFFVQSQEVYMFKLKLHKAIGKPMQRCIPYQGCICHPTISSKALRTIAVLGCITEFKRSSVYSLTCDRFLYWTRIIFCVIHTGYVHNAQLPLNRGVWLSSLRVDNGHGENPRGFFYWNFYRCSSTKF